MSRLLLAAALALGSLVRHEPALAQRSNVAPGWDAPRAVPLSCTWPNRRATEADLDRLSGLSAEAVVDVPTISHQAASGRSSLTVSARIGGVANPGNTAGLLDVPNLLIAHSPEELATALASTFQGTIVIPRDADWDMTEYDFIPVKSNVSIRGQRGKLCSRPILRTHTRNCKFSLFQVLGSNVLIEGIHFVGSSEGERSSALQNTAAIKVMGYYYSDVRNRNIRIRDNEFQHWTAAGVDVNSTRRDESTQDWPANVERPDRSFASEIVVEANLLHHNNQDGGGYGVSVGSGTHVAITGNVFEANRHAIASNGRPYSGYIATFNYIQEGGYRDNGAYQQHCDVHGMGEHGYGGIAGQYYEIAHNTIRGEQDYYDAIMLTRAAFMLRGRPSESASFHDNVLVHDTFREAFSFKGLSVPAGKSVQETYGFSESNNHYDTDYSAELSLGDFDADGRTDVFLANGTAWFVSRGGTEPWQFLYGSSKRVQELGFADINNDKVTDVIWREAGGWFGYYKYGAGEPIWLGKTPTPANQLRFGDFNGDGRTDIFRRDASSQWQIMYSGSTVWTNVASSPQPLANLRFGDFDEFAGTDVFSAQTDGWYISSGATATWKRINDRLLPMTDNLVVADFDGDRRDDIAYVRLGDEWKLSRSGRGPLTRLRESARALERDVAGQKLYVGNFLGKPRAQVLTWEFRLTPHRKRQFVLRESPYVSFEPYSRIVMR